MKINTNPTDNIGKFAKCSKAYPVSSVWVKQQPIVIAKAKIVGFDPMPKSINEGCYVVELSPDTLAYCPIDKTEIID